MPLEYTFFDQRKTSVRGLSFAAFVTVGELSVPTRLEVANLLRAGERTVIVTSEVAFDVALPQACFTERALERGC